MRALIGLALFAAPAIAADGPPPLCTDRPGKATSSCTVPKGMIQVESDLLNVTRQSTDGLTTDTILYTSPALKYGIGQSTDIEASITPYQTIRVHGGGTSDETIGGVGDLYLRVKQQLSPADAKAQMALLPYVKLPTAKVGVGNGEVEAGIVGTAQFTLPADFSLTVSPEVDALENNAFDGRHAQFVGAVSLGHALTSSVTGAIELWGALNDDPAGTVKQYSADASLAWLARPALQFDAGVNFGLNRATPGVQAYAGVSTRF